MAGLVPAVRLDVDQPLQAVAFRKARDEAFPVLVDAACDVVRDAGVERAVRPVGHDVDPGGWHRETVQRGRIGGNRFVDGRDRPGHDGFLYAIVPDCFDTELAPSMTVMPGLVSGIPASAFVDGRDQARP